MSGYRAGMSANPSGATPTAPLSIAVGADERGVLADAVVAALCEAGHAVRLVGPIGGEEREWASVGAEVARAVASGECDLGVVMCWTGTGVSIAANKVAGARAALCVDAETARLARRYNHANVVAMSMRSTTEQVGREVLQAFLDGPCGDEDFDLRNVAALDS